MLKLKYDYEGAIKHNVSIEKYREVRQRKLEVIREEFKNRGLLIPETDEGFYYYLLTISLKKGFDLL